MPRGPRPIGPCHICGKVEKLSWEHVPPKAAFNSQTFRTAPLLEGTEFGENGFRSEQVQGGTGAYTLCERCNSLTGKWYGPAFIEWCIQGAKILRATKGHPSIVYFHYILPLQVIKQIATMCFSVNGYRFRERHPELEQFVMDRDRRFLLPKYRVFAYFHQDGVLRRSGDGIAMINLRNSLNPIVVSEISHFPYGYVLSTDGSVPSNRLFEITYFARYDYNEFAAMTLPLPVLETHLGIPLDYRTREEIQEDVVKNDLIAKQQEAQSRATSA